MSTLKNFVRVIPLFAALVLSCNGNPFDRVNRTSVRLEIYLDQMLSRCSSSEGIRRIQVTLRNAQRPMDGLFERLPDYPLCLPEQRQDLPLLVDINARTAESSTRIWAEVEGYTGADRPAVRQNVIFGFIWHRRSVLRIYLTRSCVPLVDTCNDRTGLVTCNPESGRCGSSVQEPVPLEGASDAGLDADVAFVNTRDASDVPSGDDNAPEVAMDAVQDLPSEVADATPIDRMDASSADLSTQDTSVDALADVPTDRAGDVRDGATTGDGPPADRPETSVGCGANLLSDVNNCGECGRVCPSGPNGYAECAFGTCALRCLTGFGNCNSSASDGCETSTSEDPAHCGVCGARCAAPAVCRGGMCSSMTCTEGRGDCDMAGPSCETDLTSNPRHCGRCGNVCRGRCRRGRCIDVVQIAMSGGGVAARFDDGSVSDNAALWSPACLTEVAIPFGSGPDNVIDVSTGGYPGFGGAFGCVIRRGTVPADNTVWCWGSNEAYQLGIGDSSTPTEMTAVHIAGAMGGPPQRLRGIVDISSGADFTCGVRVDGSVWCWGRNTAYSCGHLLNPMEDVNRDARYATRVVGLLGMTTISAKGLSVCAYGASGIWCWGVVLGTWINSYSSAVHSSMPARVETGAAVVEGLSVNWVYACAVLREPGAALEDRYIRCWGYNGYNQVTGAPGLTHRAFRSPYMPVAGLPIRRVIRAVVASEYTAFAIYRDGTAWSWGNLNRGTGMMEASPTPREVSILSTAGLMGEATMILGIDGGGDRDFPCALTGAGAIRCWNDSAMLFSIAPFCP